jgi:hypothetical protein
MLKLEEYLAGMSGSDRQQLDNRLIRALEHLLKMGCQQIPEAVRERNARGWLDTIDEQRRRLLRLLRRHGSLKPHLRNMDLGEAHREALKAVHVEWPSIDFPRSCPFTLEEIVGDAVMQELRK